MGYPDVVILDNLVRSIDLYACLKHEYGSRGASGIIKRAEKNLKNALADIRSLPQDEKLARREPNDPDTIRKLRPRGLRRICAMSELRNYRDRLEGALLGRFAGCTLGAVVEGWPVEKMKALAEENGDSFPPTDYWSRVPEPKRLRYETSYCEDYLRDNLNGVPVDDDVAYTLLGLLILENSGKDFTTDDVGTAWVKYLPRACSAERVALANLRAGISASKAADENNPFCQWIGADIRSDPWGYVCPGWPEKAAEMAFRDAYISHRRQGIYGEMFFAATIAAAFTVEDPLDALEIGLTEIPCECTLAQQLRWALRVAPRILDYRQAREAVDRRFPGMHKVHTINNACLTVWGITIGGTDLTRVIGETVAMGLDNDCTAATAGSIVGAVVGKQGIPEHWYRRFNNTVHSYLMRHKRFAISALVNRFERQARKICR